MRSPGGQRTRISHGNMRAKLLNYIGQVFECKADSPHYSSRKTSCRGRTARNGYAARASHPGEGLTSRKALSRRDTCDGGSRIVSRRFAMFRSFATALELRIATFSQSLPILAQEHRLQRNFMNNAS